MSMEGRRTTYRVRHVPAYIGLHRLPGLLRRILAYPGPVDEIGVHSFASEHGSFTRTPTKVATVTFSQHPQIFSTDKQEWIIDRSTSDLPENVIFDTHFLGFTVLNDVDSRDHQADCIAISGLASHPFGSWRYRDQSTDFMWLRDSLPEAVPGVRSISYGYDTRLTGSQSFQTIEDISSASISHIRTAGFSNPSSKPIVFIAHSLGGIILKQAMVSMAGRGDTENHILDNIKATVAFGVPNKGMRISHLLPMVANQPNEPFVLRSSDQNSYSHYLDDRFSGIALGRAVRHFSIFETEGSQIPVQSNSGKWERRGPYEVLVEPDSAKHRDAKEEETLAVNRDHSNLPKFSPGDGGLQVVSTFLRDRMNRGGSSPERPDVVSVGSRGNQYRSASPGQPEVVSMGSMSNQNDLHRTPLWTPINPYPYSRTSKSEQNISGKFPCHIGQCESVAFATYNDPNRYQRGKHGIEESEKPWACYLGLCGTEKRVAFATFTDLDRHQKAKHRTEYYRCILHGCSRGPRIWM